MRSRYRKLILLTIFFILAVFYIAKFAGPSILRLYVGYGLGNCQSQPVFCIAPGDEVVVHEIDSNYLSELKRQQLSDIEIYLPKELKAVYGQSSKVYYKKRPWKTGGSVAYILYEEPNFFIKLFPQLNKQGIYDDYTFVTRTMNAKFDSIQNITDAFFVIMKSIFTPDLGDQNNMKIIKFAGKDRRGFISYNISDNANFFDSNIIDYKNNYFKVYIRDNSRKLNLDKVLTIIATVNKLPLPQ